MKRETHTEKGEAGEGAGALSQGYTRNGGVPQRSPVGGGGCREAWKGEGRRLGVTWPRVRHSLPQQQERLG